MSSFIPTSVPVAITVDTLESALEWASSGAPFENQAYLSRSTGELFFQSASGDSDEDLPDNLEDITAYVAVPHKNDLDLGRELVLKFVHTQAPAHASALEAYFRQRGAYSKFKSHLERANLLERWYVYEAAERCRTLEEWAVDNGFVVLAPTTDA